jgi:general stress protein 26
MNRLLLIGGACGCTGFVLGRYQGQIEVLARKAFPGPKSAPEQHASPSELMNVACSIARDAGSFAILSTRGAEGVSSRVLLLQSPFGLKNGGDVVKVVFNTNFLSKKVKQMHKNPNCSLLFFNPKNLEFVAFEGKAERQIEKRSWWREWLGLYYPEGPDGGRFSVWELKPEKVQLVSAGRGLESARDDWAAPELALNRRTKLWERVDIT